MFALKISMPGYVRGEGAMAAAGRGTAQSLLWIEGCWVFSTASLG